MPLRGQHHSDLVKDEAPYFDCLAQLDAWLARPHDKLLGVLPYRPRPVLADTKGKLLICHDYKGGYNESPSALCYTFNFWRLCDTFVYFSHHRVTIPPSGWTNAAHKQGTRMLGTLVFEHMDSQLDCLRLIVGQADYVVTDNKIPVSKRYAVFLAELAYQRGFDGYLLNFEFELLHETDQAHALASWILLLRTELQAKVGPHAQAIWYESIIYNGKRRYQNRLNGFNLPFFLASDSFFTNYWWRPDTQMQMLLYFMELDQVLSSNASMDITSFSGTKTLQSIYSGIDVWPGRGQYGDSGFCCYRAATYTAPLGFSTAIFAPAWTWESATEKAEENWNTWWDNERKMWLGPLRPGEIIPVPDSIEGPFKPMTAFFQNLPLPDPSNFAFYTNFSPGVGYSWFVKGKRVLDTKDGWSDIDKQSSIGDLVWPWPTPSWQGVEQGETLPTASTALDMTDGYNGGNTLKLTMTYPGSPSGDVIQSIWLPVQSLTLTTQKSFEACVVYKTSACSDVDVISYIYVKSSSSSEENSDGDLDFSIGEAVVSDLSHGWTQQTINFTSISDQYVASAMIGFLVDIKRKDPSTPATFSLSLGQLAVYPTPPVSIGTPSVTSVKFTPAASTSRPEGVLTWDTASTLAPIDVLIDDAESTTPAWILEDTPAHRFPTFIYFNVYAELLPDRVPSTNRNLVFVGTTGLDGRANRFYVEPACLPIGWDFERAGIRFYVQGVTDRGEVLPRERCGAVDHGTMRFQKSLI